MLLAKYLLLVSVPFSRTNVISIMKSEILKEDVSPVSICWS